MKTQTKMKKVASLAIMLATLAGTAFADQTPQDAQSQIGAQLGITHDSITQLLNKMDQQSQTNDGMVHADYKIKAQQEHAAVQAALSKFETYLRDSLFPEIRSDLASYNSIYVSGAYTDDQKKGLLANMQGQLNSLFSNASTRYSDAVYEVMASLGPSFKEMLAIEDTSGYGFFSGPDDAFYRNRVLPALLNGCYSRSCISLSASDQVILITLTDQSFGNDISFQTLDGNLFTLKAYVSQPIWRSKISDEIADYLKIVGATNLFPADVAQLPFDITDAQLSQLTQPSQLVATRKAALAQLLSQLSDATLDNNLVGAAVSSICEIGRGVENACKLGLGCPTSDEFQQMIDAESKNVSMKTKEAVAVNIKKDLKNRKTSAGDHPCAK